jgi:hypothetical protein
MGRTLPGRKEFVIGGTVTATADAAQAEIG